MGRPWNVACSERLLVSKTDKTRPWRVQAVEGDRTVHAVHSRECMADEKNCNLPPLTGDHPTSDPPTMFRIWEYRFRPGYWYLSRVQCYWSPDPYIGLHGQIKSDCGCSLCTDQWYRKRQNRRSRHQAKAQLRREL